MFVNIVKVKLFLCLTRHHAMKVYSGVEVELHAFFDLGTVLRSSLQPDFRTLGATGSPRKRNRLLSQQ